MASTQAVAATGGSDTPLVSGGETGGGSAAECSTTGSGLGRIWKWVQEHPSCSPGVSVVTGVGVMVFYGATTVASVAALGIGIIISIGSSFIPGKEGSLKWREFSMAMAGAGTYALGMSVRQVLRGALSIVPIAGNGIIYAADKHNGWQKEQLFGTSRLFPSDSNSKKID